MATDALRILATSTSFASGTNASTAVDLKNGTGLERPLWCRFRYNNLAYASGSVTVYPDVEHSDSSGSGFQVCASGKIDVKTLSTTAQQGIIYIPFVTEHRYVRLSVVMTGTPTGLTGTYKAELALSKY